MKLNKVVRLSGYFILINIFFLGFATGDDLKSTINNKLFSSINSFSNNVVSNLTKKLKKYENIKYLDVSVNVQENLKPTIEIQSVNKLKEDTDSVIFNQTNILTHDGDTTLNFGLGKRKLINNDELMIGSNIFTDFKFNHSHLRSGLGVEAISSILDFRGNYYKSISKTRTTANGSERALDGHDLQVNYHLISKIHTDIFVQTFEWKNPDSSYKEKGEKIGISSKIGNLAFDAGYQDDNKNNDGFFGNVKIVIPLGEIVTQKNINTNNDERYTSVRDKLYIPVKRENKIKLFKISSGVQISGF